MKSPMPSSVPWRRAAVSLMLCALCSIPGTPARAQADTTRAEVLSRLPPGTTLRASSAGLLLVGGLRGVSGDTLYINGHALPLSTVDRVWVQQRSTRRGIRTGVKIGAPVGAATGVLFLLGAAAVCEYECPNLNIANFAAAVLGGGAFGAVAGGVTGGTIGATVPRWVDVSRASVPPTRPVAAAGAVRTIGSVSLVPAIARAEDADDVGFGARMAYTFHTTYISFGPEIGLYGLGTNPRPRFTVCGTDYQLCVDTVPTAESVFHAGAVARVGTGGHRRVEPFGSLGFGVYKWNRGENGIELGGYSTGAGVQLRSASRRRVLTAEARWQSNLTRSGDEDGQYGFLTFGLGGSLAW
jgi:hypothetical protein